MPSSLLNIISIFMSQKIDFLNVCIVLQFGIIINMAQVKKLLLQWEHNIKKCKHNILWSVTKSTNRVHTKNIMSDSRWKLCDIKYIIICIKQTKIYTLDQLVDKVHFIEHTKGTIQYIPLMRKMDIYDSLIPKNENLRYMKQKIIHTLKISVINDKGQILMSNIVIQPNFITTLSKQLPCAKNNLLCCATFSKQLSGVAIPNNLLCISSVVKSDNKILITGCFPGNIKVSINEQWIVPNIQDYWQIHLNVSEFVNCADLNLIVTNEVIIKTVKI